MDRHAITKVCERVLENDSCVEVPLLLPTAQVQALERLAGQQESTVGQLLRRLIQHGIEQLPDAPQQAESIRDGRSPVAVRPVQPEPAFGK